MSERTPQLLLENQLCFLLYSMSRHVIRLYDPLLKPLGLTYPQYLVLLVLWEQDQISVTLLGEKLNLDSGTLSPLLKRLESMGFVKRQRSQKDERTVEIQLTPKGRVLKKKAVAIPEQLLCAAGISAKVADELKQKLARFSREDLKI